jgi:hypothetical protein
MVGALNCQQFQSLLDKVKAQNNTLVMYNNVRWLGCGWDLFMIQMGKYFQLLTAYQTQVFETDFKSHFNKEKNYKV